MTKPPETMKVLPPSQFEPLYEPTGNEQMPQPRDQGQVVYYNDPGDEEFFTRNRIQSLYYESSWVIMSHIRIRIRSRVNGRFMKSFKNFESVANGSDALKFESRFESGNLLRATRVADGEYELQLRNDLYTNRHTQWYNFQIKNMKPNKTYRCDLRWPHTWPHVTSFIQIYDNKLVKASIII